MNFKEIAKITGKKQKTVEVFFSRKKLSIRNPQDVNLYLQNFYSQKRWRNSSYAAKHLRKYHFRKMNEKVSPQIAQKFSPIAFWDRNPTTLNKREFIQRVVKYGIYEDLNTLKRNFQPGEIRSVYPTKLAMIHDFAKPMLPHAG